MRKYLTSILATSVLLIGSCRINETRETNTSYETRVTNTTQPSNYHSEDDWAKLDAEVGEVLTRIGNKPMENHHPSGEQKDQKTFKRTFTPEIMSRSLTTFLTGAALLIGAGTYDANAQSTTAPATSQPTTKSYTTSDPEYAHLQDQLRAEEEKLGKTPEKLRLKTISGSKLEQLTQAGSPWKAEGVPFENRVYIPVENPFGKEPAYLKVGDLTNPKTDEAYLATDLETGNNYLTSRVVKVPTRAIRKDNKQPISKAFATRGSIHLKGNVHQVDIENPDVTTFTEGDATFSIRTRTVGGIKYCLADAGDSFKALDFGGRTVTENIYMFRVAGTTLNPAGDDPFFENTTTGFNVLVDVPMAEWESAIADQRSQAQCTVDDLRDQIRAIEENTTRRNEQIESNKPAKVSKVE